MFKGDENENIELTFIRRRSSSRGSCSSSGSSSSICSSSLSITGMITKQIDKKTLKNF